MTIEDPIEYLHRDQTSVVHQREIGFDTSSFPQALRRVLRQDPDVILIGEMRDEETVGTALSAAETGHLVLSTLHTIDAVETVNRIIDFFPPHHHQQVRAMLAGIAARRDLAAAGPHGRTAMGRAPACEVLTMTGRVRDMISNPEETGKLGEVIAEGGYYGMQTFDQALLTLYQDGQDLDGRGAQGGHAPARLQAAGRRRRATLHARSTRSTPPTTRRRASCLLRQLAADDERTGSSQPPAASPSSLQFVKSLVSSRVAVHSGAVAIEERRTRACRLWQSQRDMSCLPYGRDHLAASGRCS